MTARDGVSGAGEQCHQAALAAFRAGQMAEADRLMAEAWQSLAAERGEADVRALAALSDLGAVRAARGDHAGARDAHTACVARRRASIGDAHPETALALHNLGKSLHALGHLDDAEAALAEAEAAWEAAYGPISPLAARSAVARARLARDRDTLRRAAPSGRNQQPRSAGFATSALAHAERAVAIQAILTPQGAERAVALEELGLAQAAGGNPGAALQSFGEALAIDAVPSRGRARLAYAAGLATGALADHVAAEAYFAAAMHADPDFAPAWHHYAASLVAQGTQDQAKAAREAAFRRHPILSQPGLPGRPRVLIPSLAEDGNIPLEHLLPQGAFTRHFWFIGHDDDPARRVLPQHDGVLNGIADADRAGEAAEALSVWRRTHPGVALRNPPERIAATRRDRLAETLSGIAGLILPATLRLDAGSGPAEWDNSTAKLGFPLLMRPAGAHGGTGLQRFGAAPAWREAEKNPPFYLSAFHETRGADGHYRKYRVACVGGRVYPYHLAIGPYWMLHYATAGMEADQQRLQEERAFLDNPQAVLGEAAWRSLQEVAGRLGLDFCGIDFTQTESGEIVIFEANATMLIHPEAESGPLAHKNPTIFTILRAFQAMIGTPARSAGQSPAGGP